MKKLEAPTTAIAKPRESNHKRWLKKRVKEHGDTDPMKLEERRQRLSAYITIIEQGLKDIQQQKKLELARNAAQQEKAVESHIEELKMQAIAISAQYNMLITQTTSNLASIEAQCLQIDCMTLREPVKSKRSAKAGLVRWSIALMIDTMVDDAYRIHKRLIKLMAVMATLVPPDVMASLKLDESDDPPDDDTEVSDEDIFTEEDKKKVQDQVAGG